MKTILILGFLLISKLALADCVRSNMEPSGKIYRCENAEAVCYVMVEKHLTNSPMPMSCFKK